MKPPRMFQDWASIAISSALMPNWISTALPNHGTAASSATAAAESDQPAPDHATFSDRAGRKHQDQHQQAEADDVGIGRAEIERGQRLGDADNDAAGDDPLSGLSSPPMIAMTKDLAVSVDADIGRDLRDDAVEPAGRARQRRADAEGDGVDLRRIDAIEPRRDRDSAPWRGWRGRAACARAADKAAPPAPARWRTRQPAERHGDAANAEIGAGIGRIDGAEIGA